MDGVTRLRPVEPMDEGFLRRVYAGTRAQELAIVPWTGEEKRAFTDMQFEAQRSDYEGRFPKAEHSIILVEARPVGRIWVDRGADEIRLLDIAIVPEERGKGTGSLLLRQLQAEARGARLPLRHSVFKTNVKALSLYERLGFQAVEDFETYLLMEWNGDDGLDSV